jgi:hypothetical protein
MEPVSVNRVSGQVVTQESNLAVPNVVVVLLDVDKPDEKQNEGLEANGLVLANKITDAFGALGDRLGSVTTDANGRFTLEYSDADFKNPNPGESRPDLLLVILGPDRPGQKIAEQIVFYSADLRRNAGRTESYFIQLPTKLLDTWNLQPSPALDASKPSAQDQITKNAADVAYVDQVSQKNREDFKTNLANLGEAIDAYVVKASQARPDVASTAATVKGLFASTHLTDKTTVRDSLVEHLNPQIASINSAYKAPPKRGENPPGMRVNILLDGDERTKLGIDNTSDGRKLFTGDIARKIVAKFDFSYEGNLLLTSDNPILRECLKEVQTLASNL